MSLSVITLEEILVGLSHRPNERMSARFEQFLKAHCEVLGITPSVARRSALLRGALRRGGKQRTQADALIAATALEHNLARRETPKTSKELGSRSSNPLEQAT
jgi:toxin FitB